MNISGIVINRNLANRNLANRKDELSKILNLNLEFDTAIDFATASENREEGFADVYFSEKGTLVLAAEDLCAGESYAYPEPSIFTFALSETAMAFDFSYTENNQLIRSKLKVDGAVIAELGSKLSIEIEQEDISEVIWHQIGLVLGKNFWEIQPEEKMTRFHLRNNVTEMEKNFSITEAIVTRAEEENEAGSIEDVAKPVNNNKREINILILLFALAIVMLAGLIYAIYLIFTLY